MSTELEKLKPISLEPLPDNPLVSILMPNYNYGKYIGEAIESVLQQTYSNWELIICDDGSTDNSCEIVQRYQSKEPRIKLIIKENGGVASALNKAYENSYGEIICLLDADDWFSPYKLEKVVYCFQQNRSAGICMNQVIRVSAQKHQLYTPYPQKMDIGWVAPLAIQQGGRTNQPPASGLSFRREITNLIFPIPLSLKALCDAYLAELASFLTEVCAIHEPLSYQRLHGTNLTGAISISVQSIQKTLSDYERLVSEMNNFLTQKLGIGRPLNVVERPGYWDGVLAIRLLGNKDKRCTQFSTLKIISEKIYGVRKVVWLFLFALPHFLSRKLLVLWWSYSRIKLLWKRIISTKVELNQKW